MSMDKWRKIWINDSAPRVILLKKKDKLNMSKNNKLKIKKLIKLIKKLIKL